MMKKLWILLFTATLLFTCLALTASAEGAADKEECYAGDTVTVTYYVPEHYYDIKSGSVEFSFDEAAFDLVSAKWEIENLFIKDVRLEDRRGVFALQSSKTVTGKVFSATYRIHEDAAAGTYEFPITLQLQDAQNPPITTRVELNAVVQIVEHQLDDEYTVELFGDRVRSIKNYCSPEMLDDINEALALYNNLTPDEKKEAIGYYEELCGKIDAYNEQANAFNNETEQTTSAAFGILTQAFSFLSEMVTLIIRTFFRGY